jgi:predicted ester cyclase
MVRLRLTGTHNGTFRTKDATGNKIDVRAVRWFRMVDGKIAEHWALLDTLALLRQIEMLPPAPAAAKPQ